MLLLPPLLIAVAAAPAAASAAVAAAAPASATATVPVPSLSAPMSSMPTLGLTERLILEALRHLRALGQV